MAYPKMTVGVHVPASPPLGLIRSIVFCARLFRLDSVTVADHFQGFIPTALWDKEQLWMAARRSSPHEQFDFQTLLGYLAAHAGGLRIGVTVTEPIRRHPVLIAQAMLTLAHLTRRPPILGIGAGERENIEPYGLDFSEPVGKLEEALQIIRRCFTSSGPIDFQGKHYRLEQARMDLDAPKGRTPEIWIAAHGSRMLRLTGQYGDGWYPAIVASPEEYAAKLAIIRAAAQAAGRDPQAITPALEQYVMVAPTEAEAREMLQSRAGRFIALLMTPAAVWRQAGMSHPFGEDFRGFIDFVPEQYDRKAIETAMAAVPDKLLGTGLMWGTPDQVARRLQEFGEAGLRHVVLTFVSGLVSRRAALYAVRATYSITRMLRSHR